MSTVRPPFFFRWLSPKYIVCDLFVDEKVIFLTFDDGPTPEVTPEVLSILKQYHATATFFVVGENVKKYPDIFEMIKRDGHSVGNHSFHHLDGWKTSPGAYIEDVKHCSDYFGTRLFRPPYGRFTPTQYFLLRKDFHFILWSVLTYDFNRKTTPQQCLQHALDHTKRGSIVVFHDNLKSIEKVRFALPTFLQHFIDLGYRFQGIDQYLK